MTALPPLQRAAAAAILGRQARLTPDDRRELEQLVASDPDARVRMVALGAMVQKYA